MRYKILKEDKIPEMRFAEICNHVESLRNIVDYTLQNHIEKKYGWKLKRDNDFPNQAFTILLGNNYITFEKSSTSRSFTIKIDYPGGSFTYPASTSLKTLDRKIDNMIKRFNI